VQGAHNLFAASLQIIDSGHSKDAGRGVRTKYRGREERSG
jgi:hypothetical protein